MEDQRELVISWYGRSKGTGSVVSMEDQRELVINWYGRSKGTGQ